MKLLLTTVISPLLVPLPVWTDTGLPAFTVTSTPDGIQTYTLSLQILLTMTALTLLPAVVLTMTSFTRVIIVLSFLRQAMGTGQTPPNPVLLGLALFLTFFIMSPTLSQSYEQGVQPYIDGKLSSEQALPIVLKPFRHFMLQQTRNTDIELFAGLAHHGPYATHDDVAFNVLVPAFITSELKTAFQMGFLIYLPFLVIDLVVSTVLMSMGMMMMSPMIISLPFKIMLFVLVDGWSLLLGTLATSFVS